jgi:endoglucanase
MDEIGLMVKQIDEGLLRITRVGGTDLRVLPSLEVIVHGREDLPGVVGMRPPHVLPADERDKPVPWDKLFVDVGLPEERVQELVRVGDTISFRRDLLELKNELVAGKAIDNRSSVAAVTLALEQLRRVDHAWDVIGVATVQEEVGLFGAITSAYGVAPKAAVAVDVTFGQQHGVSSDESHPLGKGVAIGVGPNFHPQLVDRLKTTAQDHEVPFQIEPAPGRSGTDAWAIQVSREGVPTALVGLPVRYMHQPVETVAIKDVERVGRLLATFAAGLAADFELGWEDESA